MNASMLVVLCTGVHATVPVILAAGRYHETESIGIIKIIAFRSDRSDRLKCKESAKTD